MLITGTFEAGNSLGLQNHLFQNIKNDIKKKGLQLC
jgi:hypothetical protein